MSQPNCVAIDCVFNEKMKKGLCIGVAQARPTSYEKDVIHLCWVNSKPQPNVKCSVHTQAAMTPAEAVGVGVGLIRASIIGESLLRKMEAEKKNYVLKEKTS